MFRPHAFLFFFACACSAEVQSPLPTRSAPSSEPPAPPTPSTECPADVQVQDPSTWFPSGSNPGGYEMNADAALARCGKPGLHMQSLAGATSDEFGTFMTQRPAEASRGKRIELRATMKTVDVTGRAALWLRVDGPDGVLAFDNMQMRPITGSTDFTSYSIVLDVASEARALAFGVLLSGQGELSVMGVGIRVVPPPVPPTVPTK